jgi:Protein of unknown function (DUF2800).
MAKFKAAHVEHVPQINNKAAMIGSSCHGALEWFVSGAVVNKFIKWEFKELVNFYQMYYMRVFGAPDYSTPEYDDGFQMLERWFWRNEETQYVDVISTEKKETFNIKRMDGTDDRVPFNYIIDRLDKMGPGRYRVVDYKTVRGRVSPEDLHAKIQARMYALAIQLKYPDAQEIEVMFDLLRFDTVSTLFTKDDNKNTWKYLMAMVKKIHETDEVHTPETLNVDCRYCPRKAVCKTLQRNISGGGIYAIDDLDELAALHYRLDAQLKAAKILMGEVDTQLLAAAQKENEYDLFTEHYEVDIVSSKRRRIDHGRAAKVLGEAIARQYDRIGITDVDKLIRGNEITEQQKMQLKSLVNFEYGEPRIVVKPTVPLTIAT